MAPPLDLSLSILLCRPACNHICTRTNKTPTVLQNAIKTWELAKTHNSKTSMIIPFNTKLNYHLCLTTTHTLSALSTRQFKKMELK